MILDVDECSEDTVGCAQTCTNTDGSFECSCGTGYTLSADNFGCDGKLRLSITYLSRMVIGDCPSYSYPHYYNYLFDIRALSGELGDD